MTTTNATLDLNKQDSDYTQNQDQNTLIKVDRLNANHALFKQRSSVSQDKSYNTQLITLNSQVVGNQQIKGNVNTNTQNTEFKGLNVQMQRTMNNISLIKPSQEERSNNIQNLSQYNNKFYSDVQSGGDTLVTQNRNKAIVNKDQLSNHNSSNNIQQKNIQLIAYNQNLLYGSQTNTNQQNYKNDICDNDQNFSGKVSMNYKNILLQPQNIQQQQIENGRRQSSKLYPSQPQYPNSNYRTNIIQSRDEKVLILGKDQINFNNNSKDFDYTISSELTRKYENEL
eukprot:403369140